jgi:hypothetical protein
MTTTGGLSIHLEQFGAALAVLALVFVAGFAFRLGARLAEFIWPPDVRAIQNNIHGLTEIELSGRRYVATAPRGQESPS